MRKILIVEDDPFIAMDLQDIFEEAGFNVIGPCAAVKPALKRLEKLAPDVALLDYNLGKESSIPIARKLRAHDIPFAFLSGQIASVVLDEDLTEQPLLAKPARPEKVLETVQSLLG